MRTRKSCCASEIGPLRSLCRQKHTPTPKDSRTSGASSLGDFLSCSTACEERGTPGEEIEKRLG